MNDEDTETSTADVSIQRLGRNGYLHRVIPILDKSGEVVQRVVKPLLQKYHQQVKGLWWYMDDGFLVGDQGVVHELLSHVERLFQVFTLVVLTTIGARVAVPYSRLAALNGGALGRAAARRDWRRDWRRNRRRNRYAVTISPTQKS